MDMDQYLELPIDEIKRRWSDEWVLIEVTRIEAHQVMAGWVIGHGSDQEVDRLVREELALHQQRPGAETYLFWTGEPIPEDIVVVL